MENNKVLFSRRFFMKAILLQVPILYLKSKGVLKGSSVTVAQIAENEESYGFGPNGMGPYSGAMPYQTYIPAIQNSTTDST